MGQEQKDTNQVDKVKALLSSKSIDWYAEGEGRTVQIIDDVEVTVTFVGRKGRRGRICIAAPAGTVFRPTDRTGQS
jgi:hypothetical protein